MKKKINFPKKYKTGGPITNLPKNKFPLTAWNSLEFPQEDFQNQNRTFPRFKSDPRGNKKIKATLDQERIIQTPQGDFINLDIIDSLYGNYYQNFIHSQNFANQHGMDINEFYTKYPDEESYLKDYPEEPSKMQEGGKVKPIITNDPNDPRLKAYNDSLSLYNNSQYGNIKLKNAIEPILAKGKIDEAINKWNVIQDEIDKNIKGAFKRIKPKPESITSSKYNNGFQVYNFKKPVQPVVYQSKQTNFEKRIQNPVKSIKNPDGTTSTHKMMSFEVDGKYLAAPTVVEINGKLKELSPKDAVEYAMKNKEYKEFKTDKEAKDYAANGYKKGTPLENYQSKPIPQPKKTMAKANFGYDEPPQDVLLYQEGQMSKDAFIKQHGQKVYDANFSTHRKMKSGGFLRKAGNFFQNTGVGLADNALSAFGAGTVLDKSYTHDDMGRAFKGVTDVSGKIQETAAPLVVTALGGPAAGMAVSSGQQMISGMTSRENINDSLMMEYGGEIPDSPLNVEKGEILSSPEGKILKEYKNKPFHPESGMDPNGNTMEKSGNFIIPRKLAKHFKNGDPLRRHSILMNLMREEAQKKTQMAKDGKWIYKAEEGWTPYSTGMSTPAYNGPMNLGPIMDAPTDYSDYSSLFKDLSPQNNARVPLRDQTPYKRTLLEPSGRGYDKRPTKFGEFLRNPKTQNTLSDIGSAAINNLGSGMYLLDQGKRYDKVNYGETSPDLLDPKEALNDSDLENASLNRDILNASGGNSGTYLSNRQAGSSRNFLNKSKVRADFANTNAGIKNQFKQFNQATKIKGMEDEAANKGQALTNYYQALGNIGTNTAKVIGSRRLNSQVSDHDKMIYSQLLELFPGMLGK